MTIKLGHSRLIEGLSLSVSSGETVTLMGRSGCGKSTLLAWLCGTPAPAFGAEGRVALGKDDLTALPPAERHLGILLHADLLVQHLSVGGHIASGLPRSVRGQAARPSIVAAE